MTVDRDELDELRLIRPLAEGGAFLAHDPLLDRAVVVRFLPANGLAEGRALARVAHPHLARIHHVRGGPRPYLVLEYPRGTPLDAAAPCLPTREALNVARALVGAVSTLHEAGLVHGSLRAASVILGDGGPQLLGLDGARPATPDGLAEDTRALGELLRLLGIEPPRVASALELLDELDLRLRPRADLGGNPYRGLRAYETRDHAVFFGRQEEVEVLLRRLGAEPWLVVAGRSGAGKSSLVRAGLLPAIADESLDGRGWDRAIMRPGARPLVDLATCLAPWLARSTEEVEALAQHDPSSLARLAAARGGRGLCLLIDPLDPIMTLGSDGERRAFLAALAPFGTLSPGVRVVMTLRSDFLPALSELGVVGRDLLRATVLCGAMTADGLRQAIVDPARALGFSFETEAMVEALVAEALGREAALPLLSFTLAELWPARDPSRRILPAAALAHLGGLGSALARHGDVVLGAMSRDQRGAARRLLVELVGAADPAPRSRAALLARGGPSAPAALAALVAGRLVVAGEHHELALASLASAWPRLRGWLDEASGARAAAARLEVAARDWEKLGRPDAALLSPRQLAELPREAAGEFVARSRAAVGRARRRRAALVLGLPAGLLAFVAAAWGLLAWRDAREARAYVDARLAAAASARATADRLDEQAQAARRDAFARYDAHDLEGGEARWDTARALGARELERLGAAGEALDLARARDPYQARVREAAADLFDRWLQVAAREKRPVLEDELRARLALVDDGRRTGRLTAPARLAVSTVPAAALTLHRVTRGDRYAIDDGRSIEPRASLALPPGDYLVEASAPGRTPTRLPIVLEAGAREEVTLFLPEAARIPPGYVYVPAGRTFFGFSGGEALRQSLHAEPERAIDVGAFLIAREEVTWGDYLADLALLPAGERRAHEIRGGDQTLVFSEAGEPVLSLRRAVVAPGQPACRPKRTVRRCRDWKRLPVVGISFADAQAYARRLAIRLPGARLCNEREWERAGRGADGRLFPGGDALAPGDADVGNSWSFDAEQMSEDEVGTYPRDVSPFGVHDMAGNVSEWVSDTIDAAHPGVHVARGGWWSSDAATVNLTQRVLQPDLLGPPVGFRVCAPAPTE